MSRWSRSKPAIGSHASWPRDMALLEIRDLKTHFFTDEGVVKAVDGSGGYGMLMGPSASELEIREFRETEEQ